MKPDFIVRDFEHFKDLFFRYSQGEDPNVHFYEENGAIVIVITSNNYNYWFVSRELLDAETMNDLVDKGMRVKGVFNLVLHNDVLKKIEEVKGATSNDPQARRDGEELHSVKG